MPGIYDEFIDKTVLQSRFHITIANLFSVLMYMQWIFTEFYLIALFSYVQMIVLLQRAHFLKLLITVHIKKKSFMNYFKPGIFAEIRAPLTSLMYTKRASVVQNNMHGIFDLFSPLFKTIWHWLFYCCKEHFCKLITRIV